VLSRSKIVASTLSKTAQEVLQVPGAFDPDFLVCDESGQCLEGDHMIAMTMPSIKAVILIGDQEQLPPTVVTEHSNNEGAEYLKRSLMEGLCSACCRYTTETTQPSWTSSTTMSTPVDLPPRPVPRAPTELEMRGMRSLDRTITIFTIST
jgi:superfamily I DNA and/or RNA helicase